MKGAIEQLREKMSSIGISPDKGLGEELFLFISSLVPIVNVDLLVYNPNGQFLLTRRNDPHCGTGWHVPGGCIRFKENIESRIRKVAKSELGLEDMTFEKDPIKVFEIFSTEERNIANQNERAHFITLVYKCYAPDGYQPDNSGKTVEDVGYIQWFDKLSSDFLTIQDCYKEILQ